jgi:hypothetical protein
MDPAMGMKRFTSHRRTPTTINATTICIKGMIDSPRIHYTDEIPYFRLAASYEQQTQEAVRL